MGNPALRTNPFEATACAAADNGDLRYVGGDFIARGAGQLPKAEPGEKARREVLLSGVPRFGLVRIRYRLNSYRHRRNTLWHWLAVHAEVVL